MDPEHGNATKFIQVLLTAFVSVPTLLTIFTITASLEIAGRLRGGRGVFGWIAALPWERPMVLATGLGFVMLGFGGFGGIINMGYGMNAMIDIEAIGLQPVVVLSLLPMVRTTEVQ